MDGRYILPGLFDNSRGEDLVEFAGTITGQNQNGDFLTITFVPDNDDDFIVNIFCENVRVWVSETAEKGFIAVKDSDWDLCEYHYQPPYTSIVTTQIAEEVFSNDSCHLPKVEELFASHKALKALGVEDISVITNTEETALWWKNKSDVDAFYGGYVKVLPESANPFDLVIVATPLHELRPAASEAVKFGNKNILVEKPAGLYSGSLEEWRRQIPEDVRIRIAYNRLVYPSLWKLKDIICRNEEKITSCFYTFTE